MKTDNMFYKKLKTYKAKDLHPDCEVIKKKKLDMAVKEINHILFECTWDFKNIQRQVRWALEKLVGKEQEQVKETEKEK